MTVESTTTKVRYRGNGSATEFPTGFAFARDAHVRAVLRRPDVDGNEDLELALGEDYALSGAGGEGQGTLTYPLDGAPLAEGETLTIHQHVPMTQEKSWGNLDVIDTAEIEKADDKLTRICLQLGEALERCVKMPVTAEDDPADPEELLAAASTAQAAVARALAARDEAVAAAGSVALPALGGAGTFLSVTAGGDALEYAGGAAARAKLCLGAAALADTGAAAGNVPVLDAEGLLAPGLVADMQGDAGAGGARGLVPAPAAGDAGKALLGSGAWGMIAGVPPGCVAWFGADTPPEGWLECDGAAVSRTTYADLFTAIGEAFGAGDGSTTFALPDLRGQFVRGWDNGAGVDPGRALGGAQSDQNASHSHSYDKASSDTLICDSYGGSPGSHTASISSASTGGSGGGEARPRNVALLPIIKY
ncbi:phage tail protein [Desulfocurvus sp. DL9XJH121]